TGIEDWVGATGYGICANGAEYSDVPALGLMIAELAQDGYQLFRGEHGLSGMGGFHPHTALVHADPSTRQLQETTHRLADKTGAGYLFGGLVQAEPGGFSQLAGEPYDDGISGVAFSDRVAIRSRVSQGCAPLDGEHRISECSSQFICELDGKPALDVLLADLGVPQHARGSRDGDEILRALPSDRLREGLFVGLSPGDAPRRLGFGDYLVRNVVGIDPRNRLLAVAGTPELGDRVVFCTRDRHAAHQDLIRVCTELRSEIEEEGLQVRGGLYHSCVARGANLFGSVGAEMDLIRHNLGELPLIGFHANGEIARNRIYGHTGVLTLFV
ncbi:MAG: FIST C-terminal domain-containing protein, partial [Quisquiliibacterium sp.]